MAMVMWIDFRSCVVFNLLGLYLFECYDPIRCWMAHDNLALCKVYFANVMNYFIKFTRAHCAIILIIRCTCRM